jgi:tripartite-type tricarboxylate transporter receptor subunit TctC
MRGQKVLLTVLLFLTLFPGVAFPQVRDYPNREIEIVVPNPPGGSVDLGSRILGETLSKDLGVPIIVSNKSAGGGAAGAEYVLNGKPDGYKILAAPHPLLIALPETMPGVTFRWNSFVPVIQFAHQPYTFISRVDAPYNTLNELIAFAKKNPGKLNASGTGAGQTTHFLFEAWREAAGVDIGFIPYKGGAEYTAALLGGHVDITIGGIAPSIGVLKGGKAKILVATAKLKEYPQVPTFAELGFPALNLQFYITMLAHKDTPKEFVEKLEKAIEKALQNPAVIEKLDKLGLDTVVVKDKNLVNSLDKESKDFSKVADKMRKAIQGK